MTRIKFPALDICPRPLCSGLMVHRQSGYFSAVTTGSTAFICVKCGYGELTGLLSSPPSGVAPSPAAGREQTGGAA